MLAEAKQLICLKNIDKSDWKTYRFDEIAQNISERVDPNNTDLDVYIGLEHLDSESIHIRRFGKREDVKGQKLRFYPGDVIFGRRRAYQRKAAVAELDGFCSAHALVLRANPEVIEPSLFPFFLHSDAFMHRATDISVGSLSPTINWGTLKHQEFLIPSKNQQAKLSALLIKHDHLHEAQIGLKCYAQQLFDSLIKENFTKNFARRNAKLKSFVSEFIVPMRDKPKVFDGTIPWCRIEDFDGTFIFESKSGRVVSEETIKSMKLKVYPVGTVLVSCSADLGRCAITARPLVTNQTFIGLVAKESINNKYLYYMMRSMANILNTLSSGTTISYLSRKQFEELEIYVPALDIQNSVVCQLECVELQMKVIADSIAKLKNLRKAILNKVF